MDVVRPVRLTDLDALLRLATLTGFGLTSLPHDPEYLRKRITASVRSFEADGDEPRGEPYVFVMEQADTGEVIGTSAIVSKVGGFDPFYAFRIEVAVHESVSLGLRSEIPVLHLVREHSGPSEIGALFLSPRQRDAGRGRLLSRVRFLFMAEFPGSFDDEVISEIRGVSDASGTSPFWDAVGRRFFDIDFPRADRMSLLDKRFIADLMPIHPIYVPLLPSEAQEVVGQPHPESRGALRLLEEEGFEPSGMVDIFDAGPILRARRGEIRTVGHSRRTRIDALVPSPIASPPYIVCRTTKPDFRAAVGGVEATPAGAILVEDELAETLRVRVGDFVRLAPLRPSSEAW